MRKMLGALCLIPCVAMAASSNVTITESNGVRTIRSNGLPNHQTGSFPNRNNPNTISEQNYIFTVPLEPRIASSITHMEGHIFGVAINGVPFDPGTAEFYNNDRHSGWRYEAQSNQINLGLDHQKAHVQPSGAYHYHGLPSSLTRSAADGHPLLIGYAADGFPIYPLQGYANATESTSGIKKLFSSYRVKRGTRPSGPGGPYDGRFVQDYEFVQGMGDLDECNGRYGKTPEYPNGTYYYVITEDFPFVPRCFVGVPDQSFYLRRTQGHPRMGQPTRTPSAQNPFTQQPTRPNVAPPSQEQQQPQRPESRGYYQTPEQKQRILSNPQGEIPPEPRYQRPAPPPRGAEPDKRPDFQESMPRPRIKPPPHHREGRHLRDNPPMHPDHPPPQAPGF